MELALDDIIHLRCTGVGWQKKALWLKNMADCRHTSTPELHVVLGVPDLSDSALCLDPVIGFTGIDALEPAVGLGTEPVLLRAS